MLIIKYIMKRRQLYARSILLFLIYVYHLYMTEEKNLSIYFRVNGVCIHKVAFGVRVKRSARNTVWAEMDLWVDECAELSFKYWIRFFSVWVYFYLFGFVFVLFYVAFGVALFCFALWFEYLYDLICIIYHENYR